MAINGFRADGEVYRYNASALEGDVAIPDGSVTLDSLASGVIDDTLAVDGAAADAKATGDAISSLNDRYSQLGCTYTIHTNTSQLVKESWKWNDGTLICAVRNRASASISNQSGGIYWGIIDGTSWPVAFTSTPTCTFNTNQSSGNCWCWATQTASATYAPQIYVGRGTAADVTVWVNYIAIGRWK